MKFLETHFEEYIQSSEKANLHPKLEKIYQSFPSKLSDLKNIIFYGPKGVGKYTQMLKSIRKYSPSDLKYEKKISVTFNKQPYFYKISDIHYEIDMSLLGCNSKLLWHDIYMQLIDIISAKSETSGIIVCKYFHHIHSELLENFYSYMQQNNATSVDLKYILITEEVSFIPDNILHCCEIIHVARPTRAIYNKCLSTKIKPEVPLENVSNIKLLSSLDIADIIPLLQPHKIICDKIINEINDIQNMKFMHLRDLLYDILIYNVDITECIWYILSVFMKENRIKSSDFSRLLIKTFSFFQYYNNNYRPIYHLENYIFFLISVVHSIQNGEK
jgi:hypothetical protein